MYRSMEDTIRLSQYKNVLATRVQIQDDTDVYQFKWITVGKVWNHLFSP